VPVLTDVHSPAEAECAGAVVDCLQIPALLSRQTDLLLAAGRTGLPVNIKKGQFLAPEEMSRPLEKVRAGRKRGARAQVILTERGTSFGYHNLVADLRSLPLMRALGAPVLFDGTHTVQRPGAGKNASLGDRELAPYLIRAAVAAGVDGLYLETHPDPDRALSDGPAMLPLSRLDSLLAEVAALDRVVRGGG